MQKSSLSCVSFFSITLLAILAAAGACARPKPAVVSFAAEDLFPEGVVYDAARGRFLVSSLRKGVVGAVTDAGVYTPFINDEKLISAIGLHLDAAGDRLIVCNSDPGASLRTSKATQGKLAGVGVYALADGKELFYKNLAEGIPGGHFANDAVVDKDGNIYVTDSFSPVIYKISKDYQTSEFLRDPRFAGGGFRLNGIEIVGDSLLVADYGPGKLYKIALADAKQVTEVKLEKPLQSADGLLKINDSELVVVTNSTPDKIEQVYFLKSTDNWASAVVTKSVKKDWQYPTTADLRDGDVYVLSAKLNILFGGTGEKIPQFEIYNASR